MANIIENIMKVADIHCDNISEETRKFLADECSELYLKVKGFELEVLRRRYWYEFTNKDIKN